MIDHETTHKAIYWYLVAQALLCICFLANLIVAGIVSWRLFAEGITGNRLIGLAVTSASAYINGSLFGVVANKREEQEDKINNEKNINIANAEYAEMFDEELLGKQIVQIFGDEYDCLGFVEHEGGYFAILKTALEKGGEKNSIMILEIDDLDEISEYSFAIVDDRDLIMRVFRIFCEKYKEKENG